MIAIHYTLEYVLNNRYHFQGVGSLKCIHIHRMQNMNLQRLLVSTKSSAFSMGIFHSNLINLRAFNFATSIILLSTHRHKFNNAIVLFTY